MTCASVPGRVWRLAEVTLGDGAKDPGRDRRSPLLDGGGTRRSEVGAVGTRAWDRRALAASVAGESRPPRDNTRETPTRGERRRIAKAWWFDGSGWCVLAKRLEAGSFQLPPLDGEQSQVSIDGSTFASLLAGIDFTAARRGWYRRSHREKDLKTIDTDIQV